MKSQAIKTKSLSEKNNFLWAIIVASMIHGVLLCCLNDERRQWTDIDRQPLQVHIVHQRPKSTDVPLKNASQENAVRSKNKWKAQPKLSAPSRSSMEGLSSKREKLYDALLPKQGELSAPVESVPLGYGKENWSKKYSDHDKNTIISEGSLFADDVVLPIAARSDGVEGEAIARLRFTSKRSILLVSLRGSPMLRAAILDFLMKKSAQKNLLKILKVIEDHEIGVFLHLVNRQDHSHLSAVPVLWRHNNLHIYRFNVDRSKGHAGGITLPDEKAERAEKWDQQAVVNLKNSKGYDAPIENQIICESCE